LGHIAELAHSRNLRITGGEDVDSLTIEKLVDNPSGAVILVAFKHESSVDQLRHASEILHRSGHQILGIVLSDSNL
jgi:Mrp family chromosome partitioning ATPase